MGRLRKFFRNWRAERSGRVKLPNDMQRATRDLTGPTGFVTSPSWNALAENREAYLASFDRRLPPSLHISERDRVRTGLVVPISERCIEDWDDAHRPAGSLDETDELTEGE